MLNMHQGVVQGYFAELVRKSLPDLIFPTVL
jgi:hypothetical protein